MTVEILLDALERAHARIDELVADHARLAAQVERTFRYGVVLQDDHVDVSDPKAPRARIHIDDDEDGNPIPSPWLPYSTVAGARNIHSAPSKGQQFLLIAPDGVLESGLLIPLGHSEVVPAPSTDPKVFVDGTGKTDIRFKDGKHQLEAGDDTAHLVTDKGQRLKVADLSKLVIKVGGQSFKLKMDALEPTGDIEDF